MDVKKKYFFLFMLTFLSSAGDEKIVAQHADSSVLKLGDIEHCPIEYKHGTIYTCAARNDGICRVGDSVNVTCNPNHPRWKGMFDANAKEYKIYPSPTITCQSDGTWTGPPPICVAGSSKVSNLTVLPNSFVDCSKGSDKTCPQDLLTGWIPVQTVNGQCEQPAPRHDVTDAFSEKTYRVLFTFTQHYYFGFIAISLPFKIYGARVLIRTASSLPEEALQFPKEFYGNWTMIHNQIPKLAPSYCPVVLAAYTDRFVIEFSTVGQKTLNLSKDVSPGILFYPIREGSPTNEAETRLGCPEPPFIPNARKLTDSAEPDTLTYVCSRGYVMYDPTSSSMSDGRLNCIDGQWLPHPHPVCRKIQQWSSPWETMLAITIASAAVVGACAGLVAGLLIRPHLPPSLFGPYNAVPASP